MECYYSLNPIRPISSTVRPVQYQHDVLKSHSSDRPAVARSVGPRMAHQHCVARGRVAVDATRMNAISGPFSGLARPV